MWPNGPKGEAEMVYYPVYRKVSEPRYYIFVDIIEKQWFIDIDWFSKQRRTFIIVDNPKSSPNTPTQCPPESGYIELVDSWWRPADSIRVQQEV